MLGSVTVPRPPCCHLWYPGNPWLYCLTAGGQAGVWARSATPLEIPAGPWIVRARTLIDGGSITIIEGASFQGEVPVDGGPEFQLVAHLRCRPAADRHFLFNQSTRGTANSRGVTPQDPLNIPLRITQILSHKSTPRAHHLPKFQFDLCGFSVTSVPFLFDKHCWQFRKYLFTASG